jgi:type IX secretion system PorP/SprF family membrane protein
MKNLLLLVIICLWLPTQAQQDPLYSQYITTPIIINPAYTGLTKNLSGSISYRKQWAGFDGNPVTMNASGHIALADNRMGVGVILLKDKMGSDQTTEAQLSYGYHIYLKSRRVLSFGLQGGMVNYKTDYSELIIDPNDPRFAALSEWNPTLGAGIMFSTEKFIVSVSVPKMLKRSNNADSLATGLYNRSFYAMSAYVFEIGTLLKVKPYALMRSVPGAPLSFDLGISMTKHERYTLGLLTRNFNTIGFLGQIDLGDRFRFGYVFELPVGKSIGTRFTTHEFLLGFRMRALKFHDITSIRNF